MLPYTQILYDSGACMALAGVLASCRVSGRKISAWDLLVVIAWPITGIVLLVAEVVFMVEKRK